LQLAQTLAFAWPTLSVHERLRSSPDWDTHLPICTPGPTTLSWKRMRTGRSPATRTHLPPVAWVVVVAMASPRTEARQQRRAHHPPMRGFDGAALLTRVRAGCGLATRYRARLWCRRNRMDR